MNRSRAFQGFSVALFALTGGLVAGFAGCGGDGTTSTSTGGGTTSTTSTSASTTGGGGSGGAGGATTTTTTTTTTTSSGSSSGTGGTGGMGSCAGCTAVATLPAGSAPYGLAVDATNVYWTNSGTHEVMQAKTDGTSPVTLAMMQSTPFAVQVAGGFVYWVSYSADGVMRKTPIGGGAITDLLAPPDSAAARDLAVGKDYIWWTTDPDDVRRVPVDGVGDGGKSDLLTATSTEFPNGITSDGAQIYWVYRATGAVKKADLDLSNDAVLASGDVPWDIAVDGTSIYWTEQGLAGSATGKVMAASKTDGSSSVVIATGQADPHGIAVDATSVYWANTADGTIHKAPLAGGANTVLATGQMTPQNVVVDAKYVYWTDPKADLVVRVLK